MRLGIEGQAIFLGVVVACDESIDRTFLEVLDPDDSGIVFDAFVTGVLGSEVIAVGACGSALPARSTRSGRAASRSART